MSQPKQTIIFAAFLTMASQVSFAEDMTINRLLASQCSQCHGTYGMAVGDIDSLNGESFKDLVEDMTDMRSEDWPDDIMDHQAMGYTEEQIARIARYYASLPEGNGNEEEYEEEHEEEREEERDED